MSTYGAAASIVIMLVWVYYSAQVLFLGAEFTQVYANRFGSHISFAEDQSRNPVPLTVRQRGLRTAGLAGSNYVDETVTPRVAVKGSEV
jgi:membrane protein